MKTTTLVITAVLACSLWLPVRAQEIPTPPTAAETDQEKDKPPVTDAPADPVPPPEETAPPEQPQDITNDEGYGANDAEYYGGEDNAVNSETPAVTEPPVSDEDLPRIISEEPGEPPADPMPEPEGE